MSKSCTSSAVCIALHKIEQSNHLQRNRRLQADIFISILATKLKSGQIFKIKCPTKFRSVSFSFQSIIPSLVTMYIRIKVNEALPSFFKLDNRESSNLFFKNPYNTISLLSEVRGFFLSPLNDQFFMITSSNCCVFFRASFFLLSGP